MVIAGLDEDELDEEDLAILAEVNKKGYYHGRPKNNQSVEYVPVKIADVTSAELKADVKIDRRELDAFQKKWDAFDREDTINALETKSLVQNSRPEEKPKVGVSLTPKVQLTVPSAKVQISATPKVQLKPPVPQIQVSPAPKVQLKPRVVLKARPSTLQKTPTVDAVHRFSILLVGDGGVGKTTWLERHSTGALMKTWNPSEYCKTTTLKFRTNCGDIVFNIIDANGSSWDDDQGYPDECPNIQAAIFMFDLSRVETYNSLPGWIAYVFQSHGPMPAVMVGNKVDLQDGKRNITLHQSCGMPYFETNMWTMRNFAEPLLWLARRLTNQRRLEFVGQRAALPLYSVEPCNFAEHAQKLAVACAARVGGDDF